MEVRYATVVVYRCGHSQILWSADPAGSRRAAAPMLCLSCAARQFPVDLIAGLLALRDRKLTGRL